MEEFGTLPSGETVHQLTLTGGGLTAHLLTSGGAVLQDLRLEGGHDAPPLCWAFRISNPISAGRPISARLPGAAPIASRTATWRLMGGRPISWTATFWASTACTGGADSMGKRLWRVEGHGPHHAVMAVTLPDGHMGGFPGTMTARITFQLLRGGGVLDIDIEAWTDAPTLCNLAHHSYFVLDDGPTISDHLLKVAAPSYLPVDDELIPTGELRDVAGTGFDFRDFAPVGGQAHPVDHNFCLAEARAPPLRPVAWLKSPRSGVMMECRTTEPGLQVYDGGAKIDVDLPGLTDRPMKAHAGIALEPPQIWPDANHHSHFPPQALLRPEDRYHQHTQFVFTKENT